jgi:hypothetical protein
VEGSGTHEGPLQLQIIRMSRVAFRSLASLVAKNLLLKMGIYVTAASRHGAQRRPLAPDFV